MSSRLLLAFLCIASLSTGCIIKGDDCNNCRPPPAQPGDVTFLWTFSGLRCDQARDIRGVNISIPGEVLANNGRYACSTAGVDGITLHDFAPGAYSFILQAVDYENQILFEANGTFTIDGNRMVQIDLTPTGSPGSYAYLNWTFPNGQNCAQAGVATVDVLLDNLPPHNVPCTEGQSTPGLQTPYLAPGAHNIQFIARGPSGQSLYSYTGVLNTRAYDPVSATYALSPPPAQPGDVTFLWTFGGRRCDQASSVTGVNVTIPGEVLANNGRYPCNTSGVDGITLHDFAPGTYSFTLQGVDSQNQVLFAANGTFTINGNRRVMVDLAPTGNPTSYAYLNWVFPNSQSCAQAGVTSVDINLDDRATANFPCNVGQASPGLQTPNLEPGSHFIEFIAKDASGQPLYYFNGELVTQAYNPISASYNLYAVGGASISWLFSDGSVTFDCPASNPTVYVNFQNLSTGNWVYPGLGDAHACSTKPILFSYLRPGNYALRVSTSTGGFTYVSNPSLNIQVTAHVFPNASQALQVTMYRQ